MTTREELVGGQLVVGIPGTSLTDEVARHLRAIHAAGFIAFERNYESPEQFRQLVSQLESAVEHSLLVMVDHEGGRVVRFRRGITQFPDALTQGRTQTPEEAYRQGKTEANELKALGVHVNLAPCVDVLVEGSDPVIGSRSYGSDPQRVATLASARIRGLQDHHVAACAKHFPGLGAVPKDPHRQLPTIPLEWSAMRTTHLGPFAAAIETDVATIMSSHVCYSRLVPTDEPATFSPRLMRDLLRRELGFQGVVLSDDLEMGALRELCSIGDAAVKAVEAGHDLLLICSDLAAQREVFGALRRACETERLTAQELEAGAARIAALREKFSHTNP